MSAIKWEYEILANYGYGWDMVTTEETKAEALVRLREDRENEKSAIFTIKRARVRESESEKLLRGLIFSYGKKNIVK